MIFGKFKLAFVVLSLVFCQTENAFASAMKKRFCFTNESSLRIHLLYPNMMNVYNASGDLYRYRVNDRSDVVDDRSDGVDLKYTKSCQDASYIVLENTDAVQLDSFVLAQFNIKLDNSPNLVPLTCTYYPSGRTSKNENSEPFCKVNGALSSFISSEWIGKVDPIDGVDTYQLRFFDSF